MSWVYFYFYQGFLSQTLTIHKTVGEGSGPSFYSTLPLPPAHKHWDNYLQLCMCDDYHVFLILALGFNRLLLDGIYHLIELPFDWLIDWWRSVCLFTWWIDSRSLLQRFDMETDGFELASPITLILQTDRLTKCVFGLRAFSVVRFQSVREMSYCRFERHLTEVLLIYICTNFWVSGCNIGLKSFGNGVRTK